MDEDDSDVLFSRWTGEERIAEAEAKARFVLPSMDVLIVAGQRPCHGGHVAFRNQATSSSTTTTQFLFHLNPAVQVATSQSHHYSCFRTTSYTVATNPYGILASSFPHLILPLMATSHHKNNLYTMPEPKSETEQYDLLGNIGTQPFIPSSLYLLTMLTGHGSFGVIRKVKRKSDGMVSSGHRCTTLRVLT